ncbi:MAG: formate dehydrogenase subunit gamma [Proteobacteria bacterium]|nr:MAG: formate dehydrogenase subunit gamma [Pseudomonadota bacterium]
MREAVDLAIAQHKDQPGPLLQVLHAVQAQLGYVPPAAVPVIADALNLSRAEVHGVVTFYHFFRQSPPGRHIVQICQAEACRAMHCETLTEHARKRLSIDFHQTTADGAFTLEPVYCLGNCACSPAMMVDGDLYGRVTPEDFDAMVAAKSAKQ